MKKSCSQHFAFVSAAFVSWLRNATLSRHTSRDEMASAYVYQTMKIDLSTRQEMFRFISRMFKMFRQKCWQECKNVFRTQNMVFRTQNMVFRTQNMVFRTHHISQFSRQLFPIFL